MSLCQTRWSYVSLSGPIWDTVVVDGRIVRLGYPTWGLMVLCRTRDGVVHKAIYLPDSVFEPVGPMWTLEPVGPMWNVEPNGPMWNQMVIICVTRDGLMWNQMILCGTGDGPMFNQMVLRGTRGSYV